MVYKNTQNFITFKQEGIRMARNNGGVFGYLEISRTYTNKHIPTTVCISKSKNQKIICMDMYKQRTVIFNQTSQINIDKCHIY